ncbi:MAG: LysR family transcriptional regulator, partial [Oscillospiraceae bacterium]|nr:LysR family transcriptional regulator [Oscillospiraceae bacterium]
MDFRELSYVLAIAKHQNITKAAEALYVGQPTLSKFLMALEDDLGLKLF